MQKKNYGGGPPRPPFSIQFRQVNFYKHNAKSLYCIYNKKNPHAYYLDTSVNTLILLYMYMLPYITPLDLFFVLLFTFLEKNCPPYFSSLSYAVALQARYSTVKTYINKWNIVERKIQHINFINL